MCVITFDVYSFMKTCKTFLLHSKANFLTVKLSFLVGSPPKIFEYMLKFFASLQAHVLPLKIVIFGRIAPQNF